MVYFEIIYFTTTTIIGYPIDPLPPILLLLLLIIINLNTHRHTSIYDNPLLITQLI